MKGNLVSISPETYANSPYLPYRPDVRDYFHFGTASKVYLKLFFFLPVSRMKYKCSGTHGYNRTFTNPYLFLFS